MKKPSGRNQGFEASDVLAAADAVRHKDRHKLGDARYDDIRMQRIRVAGPASGYAEAVLEVVYGFFHNHADFIGFLPFGGHPYGSGKGAQLLFGVYVEHSAAG